MTLGGARTRTDEATVAAIRAEREKGRTFRELASQFGLSFSGAHRIAGDIGPGHRTKGIFKHLCRTNVYQPTRKPKQSKREDVTAVVRAARQSGLPFRDIAKQFGISVGKAHRMARDICVKVSRSRYDALRPDVIEARKRGWSYKTIGEQFDIPKSVAFYLIKRRDHHHQ